MPLRSPLKDRPLRNPGQSLDQALDDLVNDRLLGLLLLPGWLWLIAGLEWGQQHFHVAPTPGVFVAAAALSTVVCGALIVRVRRRARALKQGRDGERVVGQFLERLRADGTQVFHDVPGEGFNLDHVIVSPAGIFVIETKTLSKPSPKATVQFDGNRILVAGRPLDRDPVAQSNAQIGWLGQLLKETTGKTFAVRGVVVFPGWYVERVGAGRQSPLWVLEPKALPAFIEHEPVQLQASDVALAAFHLSRYIRSVPAP